uniref:Uncharacterized protein n=1 Tax=Arundo donax TaxID=35708 RepID=A0A0A9GVE9_ARUDO
MEYRRVKDQESEDVSRKDVESLDTSCSNFES